MPSVALTTSLSTSAYDPPGGELDMADSMLTPRDSVSDSAKKELLEKGSKYWERGAPRPSRMAGKITTQEGVGESCVVNDNGSTCTVPDPTFITRHSDTDPVPGTDIAALVGSRDLCGVLVTAPGSEGTNARSSFVKAREQCLGGRTLCRNGLKFFTADLKKLSESDQVSADEKSLIVGARKYLEPLESNVLIDNDWPRACMQRWGGVLPDLSVNTEERDRATQNGLDIYKGMQTFDQMAPATLIIDGQNPTNLSDTLVKLHDQSYQVGSDHGDLFMKYQSLIETLAENSELSGFDSIRKLEPAMQSVMNSNDTSQAYTFATLKLLDSDNQSAGRDLASGSSNLSPSSLGWLLTAGAVAAGSNLLG